MNKRYLLYFIVIIFTLFSCRTQRAITTTAPVRLKDLSTRKIIKSINRNEVERNGLNIKKISCVCETPEKKISFRINTKMDIDDYMLLFVSKMSIPVAKILMTPDSVKVINYYNKNYTLSDYSYFNSLAGTDIDYFMIQSIFNNDMFSMGEDNNQYKDFVSYVDSGYYVLKSLNTKKLDRIFKRNRKERIDRILKRKDDDVFVVQSVYVNPVTFKIQKIILDDRINNKQLTINFYNFRQIKSGDIYPGQIDVYYKTPYNFLKVKMKLSKVSEEDITVPSFKIPEKYNKTTF